jgi:hypothetical protein
MDENDDQDRDQIIDELLKAGDLRGAEAFARTVEEEWQKAESLARVAKFLASVDKLSEAQRIWADAITTAKAGENSESPQDSHDSSSVLWEIAEDVALAGDVEVANKIAVAIRHDRKRQRALQCLADIENGSKGSFYKNRFEELLSKVPDVEPEEHDKL